MLDTFAMLSSSLCILYVMMRAMQLDKSLPWFERKAEADRPAGAVPRQGDAAQSGLPRR